MSKRIRPDNDDGEGEPLDEGLPEWGSVEEERDYWKKLALVYGAKLGALRHTLNAEWTVTQDPETGKFWIERDDGGNAVKMPLPSLKDIEDATDPDA